MPPRSLAVAAALAAALVAAPAARAATHVPDFTVTLPGDATAASVKADPNTWIVGAIPGRRAAAIAARFGARGFGVDHTGGYLVARGRARAFAAALRSAHRLLYAQANVVMSVPDDPLSTPPNDWRAQSRRLAHASAGDHQKPADRAGRRGRRHHHPELTGHPIRAASSQGHAGRPARHRHRSVAAAPANGIGILGVWPGARRSTCRCKEDRPALTLRDQRRIARGDKPAHRARRVRENRGRRGDQHELRLPVACAAETDDCTRDRQGDRPGRRRRATSSSEGNPLEFPASLPHVMTVAATDADDAARTSPTRARPST